MTITTETLQRFCAGPLYYPFAWRPYRQGGRIFATRGDLFVAIPDDGRKLHAPHEYEAKPMARLVAIAQEAHGGIAIPVLPAPVRCIRCDGAGIDPYQPCAPSVCARCDGMGEEPEGRGPEGRRETWERGIDIGPGRFQARLLRLLQALPGVVIVPGRDESSMAGIRFDGGIGGIMPLRRDG